MKEETLFPFIKINSTTWRPKADVEERTETFGVKGRVDECK